MGLFSSGSDAASSALKTLERVKVPTAADLQVQYEPLVQAGVLQPEQLQAILQGDTAYNDIQVDPAARAQQVDAMSKLRQIVDAEGMDPAMKAELLRSLTETRTANRGAQQAIMADARARGVSGSNLEFANRLLAQQQGAQRASSAAVEAAANAQNRRDAALTGLSNAASNLRTQDFGEQAQRAQAADAIARFNAQNMQDVNRLNIGAANTAQAANLAEKQRVADTNVATRNQQQAENVRETPLRVTQAQMGKAGTVAGGQGALGAAKGAEENQKLQTAASIAGTMAMMFSDERLKTDVTGFDSRAALDKIPAREYNYTFDRGGPRELGAMAQDIEKVAPAAVRDTPEGKMVDYGRMGGFLLASLSDMNRRMKRQEKRNA